MPLQVTCVANAFYLVEIHHILNADLAQLVLNVGVQSGDLAVLYIGNGVVLRCQGSRRLGAAVQEVVDAAHQPSAGGAGCIVAVGFKNINGVLVLVTHKGARLLGHGDQVCGGNDILRVVQIHQADGAHIGVNSDHVGAELYGGVGVAGEVLHIPDFVLIGNEYAGFFLGTHGVIDVQQQLHALLGCGGLAEEDGGHVALAHTAADHGINAGDLFVGPQRHHCGNGHALFVGANLLHGGMGMGLPAIGAHAGGDVIGGGGVGVAVMGEGVGESVAALVHTPGLVLAVLIHIGNFIVAVGVVLTSRQEGRAVACQIRAHIHHGAGRSTDHAQQQGGCHRCHQEPNFLHRFHFCSPFLCRTSFGAEERTVLCDELIIHKYS